MGLIRSLKRGERRAEKAYEEYSKACAEKNVKKMDDKDREFRVAIRFVKQIQAKIEAVIVRGKDGGEQK